jgi:chromosome segregation ATPase
MTSLQEDLPALAAAATEVQAQTAAVIAEGKQIERAANELLDQIAAQRAQAGELFADALQALAELEATAAERRAALEEETGQATAGLERALSDTDAAREQVDAEGDAAESALAELQHELDRAASAARADATEWEQAIAVVEQGAESGRDQLDDALHAVESELEALRQSLAGAREVVGRGVDVLADRIRSLLEDGRREVGNTEHTLRASLGGHDAHLRSQQDRLAHGIPDLVAQLRGRVEGEVAARVTEAVEALIEGLTALGQTVDVAEAGVQRDGGELQSRLEALNEAMEPLPVAIESVRDAARQAGLPWA